MKKSTVTFCLSFLLFIYNSSASDAAPPKWKYIGEINEKEVYIDTNNVVRVEQQVKYWGLINFKRQQVIEGKVIRSNAMLKIIDCSKSSNQNIFFRMYSGSMGRGLETFSNFMDEKPEPITPGTLDDIAKEILCNRH